MSFSDTAYTAAENGGIAVLRIQLSEQAAGRGVKVYYATEVSTAEEYYDYIPVSHGSATIPNTHIFADIEIELVDDDTTENTERFYVRITGVQYGAVLSENAGDLRSSVGITDADKTKLYLSGPTEVTEGSGVHQVTIRAVPPIAFDINPILVTGTAGTTATENLDYLHVTKTALLPAYETVTKTTFTIYDDSVVEGDEVLVLQLLRNYIDQDISIQEPDLRVTIRDNTPLAPTNLEVTGDGGSENQYHATLRWNYDSDADGYLLDSRKGTSGAWNCVVAGGYPSDSDSDSIQVTTLRGGYMEAGEDWYFRVRSINAHEYAVVDEATCDENAEYGYVHSDRDNEGFTLSDGLRIGPENIGVPAESPPISDLDTPTGFRIVSAQSGRVELDWDNPIDNGATTGYVIKRQWMGEHLDANGNARNNPDLCIFFPANTYRTDFEDYYVRAYDSAGPQNQYRYRLYAVNSNFSITPDQNGPYTSCDRTAPDNTPAEAVATLDLSPAIQMRNGQYTLLSPSAPTGISLSSRYWGQHDDSTIRIIWESAFIEPAFQIEHREVGEDWEEPVVHTSENFPSMLLADRTLFTPPQSSLVLPRSAIDPGVQYQIRVGTCTTVVCDDVVYSSIRTIRAATSSSPR